MELSGGIRRRQEALLNLVGKVKFKISSPRSSAVITLEPGRNGCSEEKNCKTGQATKFLGPVP